MRQLLLTALAGIVLTSPSLASNSTTSKAKKIPLDQWCAPLVKRMPKVTLAQCLQSDLKPSGSVSKKGFPLLVKDVVASSQKNGNRRNARPIKVLLLGGIHGDEKTASAIVFQWMSDLSQSSGTDFHWKIAPIVNPDGLLATKSTRVNANGVDLNRNFPTPDWDKEALPYWRKKTRSDPRRYPGKTALSEPESRWIYNQVEQFHPDVIISVHAPFGVLDFDGSGTPPSKFGRLFFNRVGVYPGSLGNYGGMKKDIPVITIELPNSQQMPSSAEVDRIRQDMVNWVQHNVSTQTKIAEN